MFGPAALLSIILLAPVPATSAAGPSFEQARAELTLAIDAAKHDPEAGLERLALALHELGNYTEELIDDPLALEQRSMATLALARGYASAGNDALALELMDQALREAGDFELPVERFGPRTQQLYDQSRAGLESAGHASVAVDCQEQCRLYVDEHEVSNPSPPLWLGTRRVLVRAVDAEVDARSWALDLSEPDEVVRLVYLGPMDVDLAVDLPPTSEPECPDARDRGSVPLLTTGGTALAAGVALTVFGSSWWARGREIDTHDYRPGGKVLVGVGIVGVALGVTLLTLETVRARKQAQRPHVGVDLGARHFGVSVAGRF